jgi:hypothetical protein
MAGEILQVDDVTAAFARRSERRDAERVAGDVGVELKACDIGLDECLDGPAGN